MGADRGIARASGPKTGRHAGRPRALIQHWAGGARSARERGARAAREWHRSRAPLAPERCPRRRASGLRAARVHPPRGAPPAREPLPERCPSGARAAQKRNRMGTTITTGRF